MTPVASIDDVNILEYLDGGGPRNIVDVRNEQDGRFRAEGRITMSRTHGDRVDPVNVAQARASCTDCQTIAVAVQVNIYRRGARSVTPQNMANAANVRCTRCVTVARAIQYTIPVDDPKDVSRDIRDLVRAMDKELKYFEHVKSLAELKPDEAEARLNQIIQQYGQLQQYLNDLRDESTGSGAPSTVSPTPATGTPATGSATPSPGTSTPLASTPTPTGAAVTPVPATAVPTTSTITPTASAATSPSSGAATSPTAATATGPTGGAPAGETPSATPTRAS